MPTPLTDSHGCPITGANSAALAYFDQAVACFGLYRGDPVALLDNACQEAPGFVMAHLLKAYLYAVATEPDAARLARVLADGIRAMPRWQYRGWRGAPKRVRFVPAVRPQFSCWW